MGDGLAPFPQKLIKHILQLQFVKIADLLPKTWLLDENAMEVQLRWQKGPVTNIAVWVQCYATLVRSSWLILTTSFTARGTMRGLPRSFMTELFGKGSRPRKT